MKDNIVKLTQVQKIIKFLKENKDKKFTAREIAEWIFTNYPEESAMKRESSKNKLITNVSGVEKDKAIMNAIQAEIGAHVGRGLEKENHFIKITEGKPRKYYYTEKTDLEEIQIIEKEIIDSRSKTKESDLYYPKLDSTN